MQGCRLIEELRQTWSELVCDVLEIRVFYFGMHRTWKRLQFGAEIPTKGDVALGQTVLDSGVLNRLIFEAPSHDDSQECS